MKKLSKHITDQSLIINALKTQLKESNSTSINDICRTCDDFRVNLKDLEKKLSNKEREIYALSQKNSALLNKISNLKLDLSVYSTSGSDISTCIALNNLL